MRKYIFYYLQNDCKKAIYLTAVSFQQAVLTFKNTVNAVVSITSIRSAQFNEYLDKYGVYSLSIDSTNQSYYLFPFDEVSGLGVRA